MTADRLIDIVAARNAMVFWAERAHEARAQAITLARAADYDAADYHDRCAVILDKLADEAFDFVMDMTAVAS